MTCKTINEKLDDLVDGEVEHAQRELLEEHLLSCANCRSIVANARRLQSLLQEYGESDVPVPEAAFFDQALAKAANRGSRDERQRYWLKGFGTAVAAGLALIAVGIVFFGAEDLPDTDTGMPSVTMALEEPRTVNLVFASASDLMDATLTVILPDGIDMAGFEGQREITWITSLKQGKNVLPLKLIASSPRGGELMATLRHEDDDRTFRLHVTVI